MRQHIYAGIPEKIGAGERKCGYPTMPLIERISVDGWAGEAVKP
jgi:hypothetical protein